MSDMVTLPHMRLKSTVALALAATALAGCSRTTNVYTVPPTTEAPTTEAPTTEAESVPNPVTDPEGFFVDFVRREYGGEISVSDETLIGVGQATCEALDGGAEPSAVMATFLETAAGDQDLIDQFALVAGAAVALLCPQHSQVWSQD